MSMAALHNTSFNNVSFRSCKLLGLHFDECAKILFSVRFENCVLNLASFYKMNLKKTVFLNTSLQEADFTEADLTSSDFSGCDLTLAVFERTNLEKADFRSSTNYIINPAVNKIKKAKFNLSGLPGLLTSYDIVIEI